MKNCLFLLFITLCYTSIAQPVEHSAIQFTTDFDEFESLEQLKEKLEGVEIIALGENTHGLGEVFKTKAEIVEFLHKELGFSMVLFESGFGDGALSWEKIESLSAREFMFSFTSNSYYHCEELLPFFEYVKSKSDTDDSLQLQGVDCQPQQHYLRKRLSEIILPVDREMASEVSVNFRDFNKLYQYEHDGDSLGFHNQRDRFVDFLNAYESLLKENSKKVKSAGVSQQEMEIIYRTFENFRETYGSMTMGGMMGWPQAYDLRDRSMFENVKWIKEDNPGKKLIIWAQNSHIENAPKPDYTVNWMGHYLKKEFGAQYYSIGTMVYSGNNQNYNQVMEFEHDNPDFLAYHLNKFNKDRFLVDLRSHKKDDFTGESHMGMESGGATASFIAKDRFDGLLFIKKSDVPTKIEP